MRLTPAFYRRKLAALRRRLDALGLAGVLLFKPANLYYLFGFFYLPTERLIAAWVPAAGEPALFLPRLEADHAAAHPWLGQVEVYAEHLGPPHPLDWLAGRLKARGCARARLGYEGSLAESALGRLRRALPGARWSPEGGQSVADMRLVKDSAELALVRKAGEYADYMVQSAVEAVCERGLLSELEIHQAAVQAVQARMARELDEVVWAGGPAGGLVCAGPRAAFPHGPPTLNRPRPGDCLLLSFACSVGGYHAESERAFFVGEPDPAARRLHEALQRAQAAGLARLAPGASCAEVHRAALAVLEEAGYAGLLRHRLGHGLGLESHEAPWLEEGDPTPLRAGMVVSVEPGLYQPGRGGWRLSDTVVVGRRAPEAVTRFPRGLDAAVLPAHAQSAQSRI